MCHGLGKRQSMVMNDGHQCRHARKDSPLRCCYTQARNRNARFSVYRFTSRIHVGRHGRTMNGLSSYLEYGRRGAGFARALPYGWDPDWPSCDWSAIWDMTYVKDGYGGRMRPLIGEGG